MSIFSLVPNIPIGQLAVTGFPVRDVSSQLISLPCASKREALAIERVSEMFLRDSLISIISKETALKPGGRPSTSAAVSPTDIISCSPVGSLTRRRITFPSSQVKKRGSVGFTPPVVHPSFENLATSEP